ncbi:phage tail assembly chaperone G [Staphylococcus succinus]|uniref:phage tail assembly chaperone G n=1 Tax=Staphylococcus succinus TaxID=61015 RepID=UPI00062B4E40|nr:hypothetical protein [Staphylococcus succinus]MDH9162066.1 hypothetical protein [Staphylococcus succinus]PNZ17382.1 hypothetical protein CD109_11015 [Staphylococcus succinus subsp. succinus]RIN43270.1 hypothetical protein BU059_06235 [Staphylococcus succinus]
MAKVTLKIDGKNKIFSKDKLNLGAMKAQAEFEQYIQEGNKAFGKFQKFTRDNKEFVKAEQEYAKKVEEAETDEEIEEVNKLSEELENMEGYQDYVKRAEELTEEIENESIDGVQIYDDFAELLVKVFDEKFTVDEVFEGLEFEGGIEDIYLEIFANNKSGKPTKKASTTKTKQQAK